MARKPVNWLMRSFRRDRRGLAEIVGTLMLVVIVVAAATAFSIFVAAYQAQVQAEETLSHNKALEDVKVIAISEVPCTSSPGNCNDATASTDSFASLSFLVSSLDVNRIGIAGLILNGNGVANYTATFGSGSPTDPCYNASDHVPGEFLSGLVPCAPLVLPPYSAVKLTFNLDEKNSGAYAFGGTDEVLQTTSDITLQVLTQLTNVFTETFAPPDAVASVFFVSIGGTSVPVFDGLNSYQPTGGNNASIVWYNWTVSPADCPAYSGAEYECSSLNPTHSYTITLEVTNTDGLSGSTTFSFTDP